MRRAAIIGLPFVLCMLPSLAAASSGYGNIVQLSMSPRYPAPGDTVTLTAANYLGDADSMTYVWRSDNTIVLQGIGQKTLVVKAGSAGDTQTITLAVQQDGVTAGAATAIIRPADVDVVWEGDTSVPPFYIGRPLPNAQSQIRVVAMPHIVSGASELPADSLVYSWTENGLPVAGGSGYGKSSVLITPPVFGQSFVVSVHVETGDGTGAADGSATIVPQSPRIAVYENAPLIGVRFEKTVAAVFPFSGDELSFSAFPLFTGSPKSLTYQWTLDGSAFAVDPARPGDVTFRKTGSVSGTHEVAFSFTNPGKFMENATASFNLKF